MQPTSRDYRNLSAHARFFPAVPAHFLGVAYHAKAQYPQRFWPQALPIVTNSFKLNRTLPWQRMKQQL